MTAIDIVMLISALLDLAARLSRELPDDDQLRIDVERIAAQVRAWKPMP